MDPSCEEKPQVSTTNEVEETKTSQKEKKESSLSIFFAKKKKNKIKKLKNAPPPSVVVVKTSSFSSSNSNHVDFVVKPKTAKKEADDNSDIISTKTECITHIELIDAASFSSSTSSSPEKKQLTEKQAPVVSASTSSFGPMQMPKNHKRQSSITLNNKHTTKSKAITEKNINNGKAF